MARITNEVLAEKLNHIIEDVGDVKEHLKTLNGQVAKNTTLRVVLEGKDGKEGWMDKTGNKVGKLNEFRWIIIGGLILASSGITILVVNKFW